MNTSAQGPPGSLRFRAGSTSQLPSCPNSANYALGGPECPHLQQKPRDASSAGTHPTATRRQRRAGRTMSASQAAANRPSGEPGPGGAGEGPRCSELHSERSAEPGSCGSSKKTQPTASARKPAYAEPRQSSMRIEARKNRRAATFLARASSGLGARRRLHTCHVTPAGRGSPSLEGRGDGLEAGQRAASLPGRNPRPWECGSGVLRVVQRR